MITVVSTGLKSLQEKQASHIITCSSAVHGVNETWQHPNTKGGNHYQKTAKDGNFSLMLHNVVTAEIIKA